MILIVDNGSLYIEELCSIVDRYHLLKYNEVNNIHNYDGIILSGRTKNDKMMNVKNINIVRGCYRMGLPLLGICYGAEIIALTFGGSIKRIGKVYGIEKVTLANNPLINKYEIDVFKSHSYIISTLPNGFRSIGYSKTSKNEFIVDVNNRIFGVQFHPELTEDGRMLVKNFVNMCRKNRITNYQ